MLLHLSSAVVIGQITEMTGLYRLPGEKNVTLSAPASGAKLDPRIRVALLVSPTFTGGASRQKPLSIVCEARGAMARSLGGMTRIGDTIVVQGTLAPYTDTRGDWDDMQGNRCHPAISRRDKRDVLVLIREWTIGYSSRFLRKPDIVEIPKAELDRLITISKSVPEPEPPTPIRGSLVTYPRTELMHEEFPEQ